MSKIKEIDQEIKKRLSGFKYKTIKVEEDDLSFKGFRVIIVSNQFINMKLNKRFDLIYDLINKNDHFYRENNLVLNLLNPIEYQRHLLDPKKLKEETSH